MISRAGILAVLWLVTGCAAHFSPSAVRQEIARQRGEDPLSTFEISIGRFTTLLLRQSLAGASGELPLAGLRELQVALFEARAAEAPLIDVTRIGTRGWDPVIRIHDRDRSGMVLLRGTGGSSQSLPGATAAIADLVVIGAGRRNVVYARLKGRLSPKLPAALGEVMRRGGPERIRNLFLELSESAEGGA